MMEMTLKIKEMQIGNTNLPKIELKAGEILRVESTGYSGSFRYRVKVISGVNVIDTF